MYYSLLAILDQCQHSSHCLSVSLFLFTLYLFFVLNEWPTSQTVHFVKLYESNSIYRGNHYKQHTASSEIRSHTSTAATRSWELLHPCLRTLKKLQLATLNGSFSTTVLIKFLLYQRRPESSQVTPIAPKHLQKKDTSHAKNQRHSVCECMQNKVDSFDATMCLARTGAPLRGSKNASGKTW